MPINDNSGVVRKEYRNQPRVTNKVPTKTSQAKKKTSAVGEAVQTTAKKTGEHRKQPAESTNPAVSAPIVKEQADRANSVRDSKGTITSQRKRHAERRAIIDSPKQQQTLDGGKFQPNKDVTELYNSGRGRIWADKAKLKRLLWNRSPEQLRAISLTYSDRTGRDLWRDLKSKFGESDQKVIGLLQKGDRVGAAASAIRDSNMSSAELPKLLRNLSVQERAELKSRFPKNKGKTLSDVMAKRARKKGSLGVDRGVDRSRLAESESILKGDKKSASFYGLQGALERGKPEQILSRMEQFNPQQKKELAERFKAQGKDLKNLLSSKLSGPERDRALALLSNDVVGAKSALLQDSMNGLGSDKKKLWKALSSESKDPSERKRHFQALESHYNKTYGPQSKQKGPSLRDRLKSEFGGDVLNKANTLLDRGEVPAEKRLQYALKGDVVKHSELAPLLKELGPEKAREIYKKSTGKNLDDELARKLGGRDAFEAKLAMKGEPKTAAEKVARAKERAAFEDSGLATSLTETDNIVRRNAGRAEEALRRLKEAESSKNRSEVKHWRRRVGELTGYVDEDVKVLAKAKDNIAANVGTVATTAVAVGATIATGGAASPVLGTAVSVGAAATTNLGTRAAMKGKTYNKNDVGKDLVRGAVEGGITKAAAIAGRAAGAVVGRGRHTLKSVGVEGAVDGAISGSTISGTEKALERETWEHGTLRGLGKVAKQTAIGGVRDAVTGGVAGVGLKKASDMVAKRVSRGKKPKVSGKTGTPDEPKMVKTESRPTAEMPGSVSTKTTPVTKAKPSTKIELPTGKRLDYDSDGVLKKFQQAEFKPIGERPPTKAENLAESREFLELRDKLRSNKSSLRKAEAANNPNEVKRLTAERAQLEKLEAQSMARDQAKKSWDVRANIIREEADRILEKAIKEGKFDPSDSSRGLAREQIAWGILRDLRRQGKVKSSDYPELVRVLNPYDVEKAAAATKDSHSFHPETGEQLSPDLTTRTRNTTGLMPGNRVLEVNPPTLVSKNGAKTRVYDARPKDLKTAKEAMNRIQDTAPNLNKEIREIHFTTLVENKVNRKTKSAAPSGAKSTPESTTGGYVQAKGEPGTMVVRRKGLGRTDHTDFTIRRDRIAHERTQAQLQAAQRGGPPAKSLAENRKDAEALLFFESYVQRAQQNGSSKSVDALQTEAVETFRRELNNGLSREEIFRKHFKASDSRSSLNSTSKTIAHEGAHAFDKANGWASQNGKWGPFGTDGAKGGEKAPKGVFSTTKRTDYVSHYARDHKWPIRANEDFAETVAFITQFPFLKDKPKLGPLSDALVAKIRGAGKAIGTPPEQIEAIIKHYGRG